MEEIEGKLSCWLAIAAQPVTLIRVIFSFCSCICKAAEIWLAWAGLSWELFLSLHVCYLTGQLCSTSLFYPPLGTSRLSKNIRGMFFPWHWQGCKRKSDTCEVSKARFWNTHCDFHPFVTGQSRSHSQAWRGDGWWGHTRESCKTGCRIENNNAIYQISFNKIQETLLQNKKQRR